MSVLCMGQNPAPKDSGNGEDGGKADNAVNELFDHSFLPSIQAFIKISVG